MMTEEEIADLIGEPDDVEWYGFDTYALPGEGPYGPNDPEDEFEYCEHDRRAAVCTICSCPR